MRVVGRLVWCWGRSQNGELEVLLEDGVRVGRGYALFKSSFMGYGYFFFSFSGYPYAFLGIWN